MPNNNQFDVCIIGAGICGCAIARELSKYSLSVCVLEKNEDVAEGTTKANSGIVHGGYAAKHGTLKGELSAKGNALYPLLAKELNFGFKQVGSLVIGFDEDDRKAIQALYDNGLKNGTQGLEIVGPDFLKKKEPHLNRDVTCGLYCKTAGITSPYEFAIALCENAIENGVKLYLNTTVKGITQSPKGFEIKTQQGASIQATYVVNAAGLYADDIAKLVGINEITITPRQGQYLLFDKDQSHLVNTIIFQTPTPVSKGVLVSPTIHGNLFIGPNSDPVEDKTNLSTTCDVMKTIIDQARKSVPDFDLRKVITTFAGNRANPVGDDFIIEESQKVKGFIQVAGIESPGLTAAPAIALKVCEILQEAGLVLTEDKTFHPYRKPYTAVTEMAPNELDALIKKDPRYGKIICRCETVSEGEIVDALKRPIPISSVDALKRRVRAGMGRCQSGFCLPRVMEIIHRETGRDLKNICKKGGKSYMLVDRTKQALK